jgi:hypothetical protein
MSYTPPPVCFSGRVPASPGTVTLYGDKNFVFSQGAVASIWTILHDLDKFPSVAVQDSGGTWQEGHVDHIDNKNLTITFSAGFSGKAYLN